MNISMPQSSLIFKRIVVFFAGTLVLGCASSPSRDYDSIGSVLLADPAVNDQQILSEYKSASGKTCRRFADTTGTGLQVRCLTHEGKWQDAKILNGVYSESYIASHLNRAAEFVAPAQLQLIQDSTEESGYSALTERVDALPQQVTILASGTTDTFVVPEDVSEIFESNSSSNTLEMSDRIVGSEVLEPVGNNLSRVDQPNDTAAQDNTDYSRVNAENYLEFKVLDGETLWDVSERVTGKGSNWIILATENNFSDSTQLSTGQSIYVPQALVR